MNLGGQLDPVGGVLTTLCHHPGVVGQHVHGPSIASASARTSLNDARSQRCPVTERCPGPQPVDDLGQRRRVPADDVEGGAELGQLHGHRLAKTRRRAGHDHGAAREHVGGRLVPTGQAGADGVSDPGETADDGGFEHDVDGAGKGMAGHGRGV